MKGRIKKLVPEKSFGFIRGDDGRDYFLHRSGVMEHLSFDDLKEQDYVTFEDVETKKGWRAEDVELAS